jgi:hypothetical protein
MLYEQLGAGILVHFAGPEEVEAVGTAFKEHNAYLESIGNDSSVHPYDKFVANWTGDTQVYRSPSNVALTTKLQHLLGGVEDRVDEILDTQDSSERIQEAARRYRLGEEVRLLLESIEVQSAIETEARDLLGE